jgi:putative addiction module component (TIGR02574 family)
MASKSQALLEAALSLPESERAEIAAKLLSTLAPDDATVIDDELTDELERRIAESRLDPSSTVPWGALKGER